MLISKYRVTHTPRSSYTEFPIEKELEAIQFANSIGSVVVLVQEEISDSQE